MGDVNVSHDTWYSDVYDGLCNVFGPNMITHRHIIADKVQDREHGEHRTHDQDIRRTGRPQILVHTRAISNPASASLVCFGRAGTC